MFADIEKFCSDCGICSRNKRSTTRRQPLVPFDIQYKFPRAVVSYDFATLPWSSGDYCYALVITDLFSKYVESVPMKNQEAATIVKALE